MVDHPWSCSPRCRIQNCQTSKKFLRKYMRNFYESMSVCMKVWKLFSIPGCPLGVNFPPKTTGPGGHEWLNTFTPFRPRAFWTTSRASGLTRRRWLWWLATCWRIPMYACAWRRLKPWEGWWKVEKTLLWLCCSSSLFGIKTPEGWQSEEMF